MNKIKNIIFDLGAVLLNLDMSRTELGFKVLIGNSAEHLAISKKLAAQQFFEKFETNEIEELEFVETLKAISRNPLSDGQINSAWSAMLLDMPAYRIEMLRSLRKKGFKLFLLSNINSIHLRDVYSIIREEHGELDFDALFDKPYYSHLIGRRKPNPDTFRFVLDDAGILPEETLFVDDNADNVKGAAEIGLNVIHHLPNSDIEAVLKDYLKF
jgi:glucose-1-phosphatase